MGRKSTPCIASQRAAFPASSARPQDRPAPRAALRSWASISFSEHSIPGSACERRIGPVVGLGSGELVGIGRVLKKGDANPAVGFGVEAGRAKKRQLAAQEVDRPHRRADQIIADLRIGMTQADLYAAHDM